MKRWTLQNEPPTNGQTPQGRNDKTTMTTQNISRALASALAAKCNGTVADSGNSFLTIEGSVTREGVQRKLRLKVETLAESDGKVPMLITSAPPDLAHREALNIVPYVGKVQLYSTDGAHAVDKKADLVAKRLTDDAVADFAAFEQMRGEGAEQFAAQSEVTRNALVGVTVAPETNLGLFAVEGNEMVEVKVLGSHVKVLGLRLTVEKANAVIAALTA